MVKKFLEIVFIIILFSTIGIVVYIANDVKSVPPEEVIKQYHIEEKEYAGRDIFYLTAKQQETINSYKIIYIHGGSYAAELSQEHWTFLKSLVDELNCTIIIPDYPLTPKYNYKDVFAMMMPFYKEIVENNGAENIILMGDSAGGGLALALLEELKEYEVPKRTILISPWLDVTMKNPEIDEVQKNDKALNKLALKLAGELYAGEDGIDSYLVNPINGPLENLNHLIIFTGTYDILNPDVHSLEKKTKAIGVTIQIEETEGAMHNWIIYNRQEVYRSQEDYQKLVSALKNEMKK